MSLLRAVRRPVLPAVLLVGLVCGLVCGLVLGLLAGLGCGGAAGAERAVAVRGSAGLDRQEVRAALRALGAVDQRRSRAWEQGDLVALADVYAAGASAGRRDVAALRAWEERGLRVEGMTTQVLEVRAARADADRVRLDLVDRVVLAGARVVGRAARTGPAYALPRDRPTARTVELVRVGGVWRVARVVGVGQPLRSAVASSASRSGSAKV